MKMKMVKTKSLSLNNLFKPHMERLIRRLQIEERYPAHSRILSRKLEIISRAHADTDPMMEFLVSLISGMAGILLLVVVLTVISGGGWVLLGIGILLSACYPLMKLKQLDKRIEQRKRQIVLELPDLLSKITLLVNAGETIQKALQRCVKQTEEYERSPLMAELYMLVQQLQCNSSFSQAMEQFNKRCGVQEVSIFTTTVLLNYRRGGEEFVLTLCNFTRELWEKRKSTVRTLGEEASSKLVFPMVCIFLAIMVIIATPAIMFMSN